MFNAHYLGIMRDAWDACQKDHSSNFIFFKPESSRLLDDDPYQAGYGYGALNHAQQASQPDPEYVRREREALESICQRTSDSVIDIWSLQPQPHLQPQATLHTPISASPAQSQKGESTTASATRSPSSRPSSGADGNVPKHWGEVVVNPNKKRSRPDMKTDIKIKDDVFGVLSVN
ncbi:hypothetical protein PENANT_c030G10660 [Penicillium antarcticum]|uniref:Uncharacterized protein n=1 Tax=Penicillium antarcticum TaxID=416450 RepID=A0A1V6PVM7_9EURO|nr:uncharacterized protein N7508_001521 [Penicillium antarcticum]KAJ5317013.1 hypothetical protein N7508_001521 [Penicillium antarcticum]OQD81084.1 hypothetical protein PENANT_c030G10660 [Penicillium antarcticum]